MSKIQIFRKKLEDLFPINRIITGKGLRKTLLYIKNNILSETQITTGLNWRFRDFHPSHLRVIYESNGDNIVDKYLDGHLSKTNPTLHSGLI